MPNLLSDDAVAQLKQMFREFENRLRNSPNSQPGYTSTPSDKWVAKTTTTHDKGQSEDVDFYSGSTKGSETATGVTVSAYNRFADLATGKWCFVEFIDGGWGLYSGEC